MSDEPNTELKVVEEATTIDPNQGKANSVKVTATAIEEADAAMEEVTPPATEVTPPATEVTPPVTEVVEEEEEEMTEEETAVAAAGEAAIAAAAAAAAATKAVEAAAEKAAAKKPITFAPTAVTVSETKRVCIGEFYSNDDKTETKLGMCPVNLLGGCGDTFTDKCVEWDVSLTKDVTLGAKVVMF